MQHEPEAALSAAMQSFWRSGYHHTSLRDLLSAMNISRSSLYHAYGSKEALFTEALTRYRDQLLGELATLLAQQESAWHFIDSLLTRTAEQAESEQAALGCLIFNSATELGNGDSAEAQAAKQSVQAITDFFVTVIEQAQQEGAISPGHDAGSLAYFLTLSMSGLRLLLKSGVNQQQAKAQVEHVLRTLASR
ncbi:MULTISPECIES: TetR/AcrR family transcriptional regulator [Halomonadaceae]|jgi:TetR/AcrR family transcriptional repressor of nem operon|uniref:TetR/AcrR family transcriptional regulator n=2 Tax=Oceanospirillales TaxID=135619 RepID=UPI001C632DE7|nr:MULTISPECIES: TetR/AcrR family transcriptional regulator [Halomonas]MCG7619248.1 TetR/AcrR family transcriptional regulator [Halomonas sp. DSH1-27]MCG7576104.1 TetR/AcrR family transcriptional regulator [Halomonas sp. MMH1-48]MCG7590123.1 TetR/AcrR family transcriptional regulator [Halomonas sp. McD50-5]MCG7603117.1 TetR/AcrR family transcriptional regulator [Halomonas sp. MM17-34]MCG7615827.1 TetR/AcrR family transcriptional regulator [Halomonas sp. McD50-4]|tara:strand:- start:33 stop:608 length:576 start_codon:yes stop_codon:yes gene_type:complete